ncbi:DUF1273 domain-containing protein [Streptococcus moroccensis]|uniref:DUF1273 domain-containing protein n=1 Tax=Streptococcus moroccensis TaxID=1451356 RepID=UPI0027D8FF14|nr:DUF1273 domain-containing protein [Streptococcus moroccensis]
MLVAGVKVLRLLLSGYRHTDLGLFNEKDPRVLVIKEAIKRDLMHFLDDGLEWLIFTGNLGFEYWVLEEALRLKEAYDLQLACIFPFETHGENWSDQNQEKLAKFKTLDFVTAAYKRYENPGQFRDYNTFLIDHTDGAYLFYDPENETNLKYLYEKLHTQDNYFLKLLRFDDLNEIAENFSDFDR